MFDRLEPQVLLLLPEARERRVDVWVQELPALYRFAPRAYQDADGFFSESEDRIHLREGAESLERTLAHELVHAHLRGAWRRLPGTIEEGLCDHVSGELCPEARSSLRAGRLSCAAFALGGLTLDLTVRLPESADGEAPRLAYVARLTLDGEAPMEVDPLGVFERQAGLSSSRLSTPQKKAYYGLAYLVARRLVGRVGIEGLHQLCVDARDREEPRVPRDVLLAAAGLGTTPESWRAALEDEFEAGDLQALVRSHPEFLVRTLAEFLGPHAASGAAGLEGVSAELALAGTDTRIELLSIDGLRESLLAYAKAEGPAALAGR
ncbi:MAG: hypothetical protein IPJ77_12325 [Planctomycetes bacterium]|nr:hypothetical protein [Planctomycetota bacterium]